MLSRSDHFSSLAMFRNLFNSSKPESATAELKESEISRSRNGLIPGDVPVPGADASVSPELAILRHGFEEREVFYFRFRNMMLGSRSKL